MAPSKSIVASAKAVDPTLDALFASSVRPAEARARPKYEGLIQPKPRAAPTPKPVKPLGEDEDMEDAEDSDEDDEEDEDEEDEEEDEEDEEGSEESSEEQEEQEGDDDDEDMDEDEASEADEPAAPVELKKRKRKNREDDEDLESRYLEKISREVAAPAEKRLKRDEAKGTPEEEGGDKGNEEEKDDDVEGADEPIVHESLLQNGDAAADGHLDDGAGQDKEKAARTVFLSNVSIEAVTSKAAKKTLLAHLSSVLEEEEKKSSSKDGNEPSSAATAAAAATIESLRFRSVPFATAALPKRAAFITKAVMGATAQSANAYVVYSTAAAARRAVRRLNGTVVLGRHLRADSVAHPSPVDHRRCVFVGNLGFVDDETIITPTEGEDGEGEERKKRHKVPMDVEEGLWRTFGKHAGRVESVRVVRDPATRVGKGIAYVQFVDANSVESALLLAGKKYPPLLPRPLRVSRCKAPHKTARAVERATERAQQKEKEGGGAKSGARNGKDGRRAGPRSGDKRSTTTGYTPKLTAEQQTSAGRAAKLLGRSAATGGQPLVFEGMRARVGHNSNLFKKGKKKSGGSSKAGAKGSGNASNNQTRRASRAANWRGKKGGGQA